MYRFIKEYANWKRREVNKIEHTTDNWKLIYDKKNQIDTVMRYVERGMMTVDEAMRTISEV